MLKFATYRHSAQSAIMTSSGQYACESPGRLFCVNRDANVSRALGPSPFSCPLFWPYMRSWCSTILAIVILISLINKGELYNCLNKKLIGEQVSADTHVKY